MSTDLLLLGAVAYVGARSGLLGPAAEAIAKNLLGSIGPGLTVAPDSFSVAGAQKLSGSTGPLSVQVTIGHKGPGGQPYKLVAFVDRVGYYVFGMAPRSVGWTGTQALQVGNDPEERAYTEVMTLARIVPSQVNASGVWDITIQVQTPAGGTLREARFPGAVVV